LRIISHAQVSIESLAQDLLHPDTPAPQNTYPNFAEFLF
jgi:hypothetical protein